MQKNGLLGCFWWLWAIILHTLGVQVSETGDLSSAVVTVGAQKTTEVQESSIKGLLPSTRRRSPSREPWGD